MLNQEHITNETITLVAFGGSESRSKISSRPVRSICDSPVGELGQPIPCSPSYDLFGPFQAGTGPPLELLRRRALLGEMDRRNYW
jgi:hypothetical protein